MPRSEAAEARTVAGRTVALTSIVLACALALSGCATSSAPAASPAASSTPSPTPPPDPEPRAAFGGDCDAVVSEGVLADVFGNGSPQERTMSGLTAIMPDAAASIAVLGGAACAWSATGDGAASWLQVLVAPADAVPAAVVRDASTLTCRGPECGLSAEADGTWVYAGAFGPMLDPYSPSEDDIARLGQVVDAVIADVLAQPADARQGVAVPVEERGAALPACDDLEALVAAATGMDDPQAGYPSDNVPGGVRWDLLEQSGLVSWCPWYAYDDDGGSTLVEIELQAAVGAPAQAQLDVAGAEVIAVDGADSAHRFGDGSSARAAAVVISVEQTRATIRGDAVEDVAAAVAAVLGG